MILNSISILNYRNIEEATLSFSPKVNCFTGNNGMGKTNMLDAIYYLSFSKSYLNNGDSLAMRNNTDFMMLQGSYLRRGEYEDISLGLQRGKRKVLKRGGKEYQKLSQHIGLIPLVMISPQDWELIRGSGSERRRLIDQIISQSNSQYLTHLIRYNKSIESRNMLLKQGMSDPILLETIEMQISDAATIIHSARAKWIEDFTPIFHRYYNAIAQNSETVKLEYRSELNNSQMQHILDNNRNKDIALSYTSQGIHRDDIELLLSDHPMRKIGSQGQCKTYTIALRLAQYDFLKQQSGLRPILLLDDIFDKLDSTRVKNIMKVVAREEFGQIFITDTNRTHLDEIIQEVGGDYRIYYVDNGKFAEVTIQNSSI